VGKVHDFLSKFLQAVISSLSTGGVTVGGERLRGAGEGEGGKGRSVGDR